MAIAEHPQPVETTKTIDVTNPITSEVIGSILSSTSQQVVEAYQRAKQAQPAWYELGVDGRRKLLRKWQDKLWASQEAGIKILRQETGKPYGGALIEFLVVDNIFNYYYHEAPKLLKDKRTRSVFPGIHSTKIVYKPHGVVGIISPWNYPFTLPFIDMIPALLAGNAVLLKPSEFTPYSAEFGVNLMHEVGVPKDVIQIVHGDGRAGSALVDVVDYIHFTGSTAVGRKVAVQAAERLIPYTMELGGKDASLVLKDADLDMAAAGMLKGAFENAGQTCISIERAYIEHKIYEPFIEKIQHYAQDLTLGKGDGMDVYVGSLANSRELERTEAHIQDAVNKGARVIHGGKRRPDLGPLFFEPTILVDVDHSMDVMRDETFGPVLPIMKVTSEAEAIRLANDSYYGLSASIFASDFGRAEQIAKQIDSGDVAINRPHMVIGTPSLPSGGQKQSGSGRRNGTDGLLKYVTKQSLLFDNQLAQKPELIHADKLTLRAFSILRKIRRYVSFI